MRERWAVFISGRGSNLSALLHSNDFIKHRVAVVVSSRTHVEGVKKARRAGIPVLILEKKIDWQKLSVHLQNLRITNIMLAGFMKIVPDSFIHEWQGKMINIHPSLLPAYPGLKSIEKAWEDQSPIGVTIHEVTEVVDGGEILAQKVVFNNSEARDLNLSEVTVKVHQFEHRLLRRTLARCSNVG